MMGDLSGFTGIHADPEALGSLANRLRGGAEELDSLAEPAAPEAGECTEAIAGLMAMLTMSAADITEVLSGMGDAVAAGRDVYGDLEAGTIKDVSRLDAALGDN